MTRDDAPRRLGRLGTPLSLIAAILAGAAFALAHAAVAWRTPPRDGLSYHGFCAPPELLIRELYIYAPGSCLVQLTDDGWRPLRVEVRLRARSSQSPQNPESPDSPHAGGGGRPVRISVNDRPVEPLDIGDAWTRRAVDVPPRDRLSTMIQVRLETTAPSLAGAPPIEVAPVEVTRVWTRGRTLRTAALGALAGAMAWITIVPPLRARRRERAGALPRTSPIDRAERPDLPDRPGQPGQPTGVEPPQGDIAARGRTGRDVPVVPRPVRARTSARYGTIGVAVALAGYFSVWALLRPPYQTPDEVQHHLRATAVLRHPWIAGGGEWTLDPRFTNPLALWTPPSLDKLFFNPRQRLTGPEIAALEAMPWPAPDTRPIPEPYRRAIASYPTLYYLAVFAAAEPMTRALSLSPYQSTYAYRLVSGALAALLWAAVYRTLRGTRATHDLAGPILAFLVLNPMVAFVSSGINPDAVNVPLATLAVLLLWRVLDGDAAGLWAAWLALMASAWTKPSGLQIVGAFALTAGALWALGRVSLARLRLAGAVVAGAVVVVWCGFYAWSAPRFVGGPPVPDTLGTYLALRWTDLAQTWVEYWGTLGWLEYALPARWYQALLVAAIAGLLCTLIWPRVPRLFAAYAALFFAAFLIVTTAGEFAYLPTAGYFLQGRHLLPGSVGLVALLLHRVRPARVAFLALLLVMNVLLLHATVGRYYTRGWSAVTAALPFGR